MRTPRALVTLRYADPLSFRQFVARAQRQPGLRANADAMLCGLLDSVIDRAADVIENAGKDLDGVSRGIFGYRSEERRVGTGCVSQCRSRWSPYHQKKKRHTQERNHDNK